MYLFLITCLLFTLYTSGILNQVYGIIFIGGAIILFSIKNNEKIIKTNLAISSSFIVLVLYCISYVFFFELTLQSIEYYIVCPVFAYLIGWNLPAISKIKFDLSIKYFFYSLILGYGIHASINAYLNRFSLRKELIDYATGSFRSATGSGCINTMIFSLFLYILLFEKKTIIIMGSLALLSVSLLYAVILGTRTQFVLLVSTSLFLAVVSLIKREKNILSIFKKPLFVFFILLFLIQIYRYFGNTMYDYYISSNLQQRYLEEYYLNESTFSRETSFWEGLYSIFEYPLGNPNKSYYHNTWLDIYRVAGIIPFFLFVLYSAITNKHLFEILLKKAYTNNVNYMLGCAYFGIQLNLFVEPGWEGFLGFILIFIVINGIVDRYYYSVANNSKNSVFSDDDNALCRV